MCEEGVVACFAGYVYLGGKFQLYEHVLQVGKCYAAMILEVILKPDFSFQIYRYLPLAVVVTCRLGSDRKFGEMRSVTLSLLA